MIRIKDAFITGYMRGHHDTVESCYGSPEDSANDYIESAMCEADSNVVLSDVLAEIQEGAFTDNNTGEKYVYIEQLKGFLGKYFR